MIKPGTRVLHYEVMVDGEVVDYGWKHFKGVWSEKKLKWILLTVEAIVERYEPNKVEMKVPHPGRRSMGLEELIKFLLKHYPLAN